MRQLILYILFLSCTTLHAQHWYAASVPYGRDVNSVYIQNPTNVFVAGGHAFNDSIQDVYGTNGVNWNYILDMPVHRGMLSDITFTDSLHGYACGYNGNVIMSTDGGQTWNLISTPITGRNYRKMIFLNSLKAFAVGANYNDSIQTIITTADGGATWSTVIDQVGFGLNGITFINSDTGYAVGDKGAILATVDGGNTWTPQTAPVGLNFLGIKFTTATTGYIVGGDDSTRLILNTTDGGANWNVLKNERGSLLTDITFSSSKGYIVGARSSLLSSNDGGQTWTYDTVSAFGPGAYLTSVGFYNDSFGVVGSKGGSIFFYTASSPAAVYTIGASLLDSSDVRLSLGINTHGQPGQYFFTYTSDSTWNNYLIPGAYQVTCDSDLIFYQNISGLIPRTVYYYYASGSTLSGTTFGDTLKFYTGIPYTTFSTLAATNITNTSVTLNGLVDKFLLPVAMSFEYGSTPALGNIVAASPSSISDTFVHNLTANLTGLQSGTVYYYRLKGHTAFGDNLGNIYTFYTGPAYTGFGTDPALYVSDSAATLVGTIDGFITPATLSFEYGTTPAFGTTITSGSVNPGYVNDTMQHTISTVVSWPNIQPYTLYFYRLVAQTVLGTFYANTETFYTGGNVSNTFATFTASGVTSSTANLNGSVSHFPTSVALSFDYGTTQSFGDTVMATPATVNDTNYHQVSASLTGLSPNTVYYYRLKGTYPGGTVNAPTKYFYTGNSDIPNWDFQLWYNDTVSLPDHWRVLSDNFAQVPGHSGSYAARIMGATALLLGIITDGTGGPGHGPAYYGGASLNARPDSLIAYLNYNIQPGDTGYVLTYLYSGSATVIAQGFNPIWGNSGGGWSRVAIAIPYSVPTVTADSIVLGFISVNAFGAHPINLNSPNYIAVDDITFSPPPPVALPNAGFENWFTYGTERLIDWPNPEAFVGFEYNPPVGQAMIKKAYYNPPFDFAAEVDNIEINGGLFGGSLSTKKSIFTDIGPTFPVFLSHQTLNGFYKFYPVNHDTLHISIGMYKNGQEIGRGEILQTDTVDSFSPFEVSIIYDAPGTQVPDSATIDIGPHGNFARGLSRVIVDKLSFDGYATGMLEASARKGDEKIWMYPNPASTMLTLEMTEPAPGAEVMISDIDGRIIKVLTNTGVGTILKLDISDLNEGMYLVNIRTLSGNNVKKLLINR